MPKHLDLYDPSHQSPYVEQQNPRIGGRTYTSTPDQTQLTPLKRYKPSEPIGFAATPIKDKFQQQTGSQAKGGERSKTGQQAAHAAR